MVINYKVIFFPFFLFATLANAQLKGTLNYKFVVNDGIFPKPITQFCLTYFNANVSIEIPVLVNNMIEIEGMDENKSIKNLNDRSSFIYKKFSERKIVLSDYLGFKTRLINDTLQNFTWILTKEKRKISNFNCIKATTKFRGRNYIAWFTEDIPIQNGPWKFCGLPGLIVKINDDKLIFNWELTGVNLKAKFDKNLIAIPRDYIKDKPISHRQFMNLHNRMVSNNKKAANVVETGKDGGWATKEIILPPKIELF